MEIRTGTSRRRASSKASSPHSHQSTGLSACWRRYGEAELARRLGMSSTVVGGRSFAPGSRKAGRRKPEGGRRKSEGGRRKSEGGSRKSEVGSRKSIPRRKPTRSVCCPGSETGATLWWRQYADGRGVWGVVPPPER